MRLINSQTFELRSFLPHEIPEYVILSHRWGPEEITYKNIIQNPISDEKSPARQLQGFAKVKDTCKLASDDGYSWVWIDSCCIDKESSTDVDKAINSMWAYYMKSNICYVYMADIPDALAGWSINFQKSNWFTRGWTLQELIAPVYVEFYAADWSPIGTKLERYKEIAEITTIDRDLLALNKPIDGYTTAERLSWAAHRQVTQEEDESYSLLGLFQIHMPMLYGEGRSRAFARLQEEIYLSTCDDSIFLFRYSIHVDDQPLIADCPTRFCQRANCDLCQRQIGGVQSFPSQIPYCSVTESNFWRTQPHEQMITTVTPYRNEMSVPLSVIQYGFVSSKLIFFGERKDKKWISHVAILNHTTLDYEKGAFCLLLYRPRGSSEPCFYRLSQFPALLPNVDEIRSMMQKTKILIPGPHIKQAVRKFESIFSVPGDRYKVQAWNAKMVDTCATISCEKASGAEHKNVDFQVQEKEAYSNRRAEVSCRLTCHQNFDESPEVLVELEKIVEISSWSIKKVSEVSLRKRSRKHRVLFLPSTPSDRCKIQLTAGNQLYIGIRRVAASNHPRDDRSILHQRYQIFVRPITSSDTFTGSVNE
jgi:hypothetical protein